MENYNKLIKLRQFCFIKYGKCRHTYFVWGLNKSLLDKIKKKRSHFYKLESFILKTAFLIDIIFDISSGIAYLFLSKTMCSESSFDISHFVQFHVISKTGFELFLIDWSQIVLWRGTYKFYKGWLQDMYSYKLKQNTKMSSIANMKYWYNFPHYYNTSFNNRFFVPM